MTHKINFTFNTDEDGDHVVMNCREEGGNTFHVNLKQCGQELADLLKDLEVDGKDFYSYGQLMQ